MREPFGDSEFSYEVTVRLPTGEIAHWEVHASQTAYEALWRLAAVYGQALLRARLVHAGRPLALGEALAPQRVLPGALLTLTYLTHEAPVEGRRAGDPEPRAVVLVRVPGGRILAYDARPEDLLGEIVPWAEAS